MGVRRSVVAVVFPGTAEQVADIVRLAATHRVPVYPVSTGRNWGYGTSNPVVAGCLLVNLSRMSRIVEPPDRVTGLVTIEPGVTQGQLAAYLEQENLPFLVPTTGAGPSASLIGNALERGYGITPIADHFSAVLSIEAVLPDGSLYRSPLSAMEATRGGHGFRWGIGPYVDGLFAQGGFGIVTRMTIALARRPECIKAFVFSIRADSALEDTISSIQCILANLSGVVGGINVMNARRVLAMSAPYPADRLQPGQVISGPLLEEMSAQYRVTPWTVFGTLYGTRRVVAATQRDIRRMVPSSASRLVFISPRAAQWLHAAVRRTPLVRNRLEPTLGTLSSSLGLVSGWPNQTALPLSYWKKGRPDRGAQLDPARDGCGLVWYAPIVEIKPESVRRYVDMVNAVMPAHGFEPLITLSSLSERCFGSTVPVLFDLSSPKESEAARTCHLALLDNGAERGFLPYRVDVRSMGWLMARAPEYWEVVSRLKRALDPAGLLSPGRYAPAESGDGTGKPSGCDSARPRTTQS
jgi:FAD/FMN-containing dehydrogenase